MGEIKSDIGSRTTRSAPEMKRFVVDDGSQPQQKQISVNDYNKMREELLAQERERVGSRNERQFTNSQFDDNLPEFRKTNIDEIKQSRAAQIRKFTPINDEVKRRVEFLTGIGVAADHVEIEGCTFSLRTLKAKEQKSLIALSSDLARQNDSGGIYTIRERILSMALYAIDNINICLFLNINPEDEEERYAAVADLINELDESVVNTLFKKYEDLTNSNMNKFAIKNEADAMEVASDIKKSSKGT